MKTTYKYLTLCVVIAAGVISLSSCVSENPFDSSTTSGEGTLRIATSIKGDVLVSTRAEGEEQSKLENNLVVYVERQGNDPALVRKFIGKNSIPSSIMLSAGDYVVEGWTGDSVSASWDKKFYRGYQPVKINPDDTQTLSLTCAISNVLVSVSEESLNAGLSDLKVSFWHSHKGNNDEYVLNFTESEITSTSKGYFMMPTEDHISGKKESVLNYKISGVGEDGSEFTKEGVLSNVVSAHEYKVTVKSNSETLNTGGALIQLDIADIPILDTKVEILPPPAFKGYYGSREINLDEQLDLTSGVVQDAVLTSVAYGGVRAVNIYFNEELMAKLPALVQYDGKELIGNEDIRGYLSTLGIGYRRQSGSDEFPYLESGLVKFDEVSITLSADFLSSLPENDKEYAVGVEVADGEGDKTLATLRFANSDAAVERKAPVGTPDMNKVENQDLTAITPYSATLYGEIYTDDAENYGIKYRESGTSDWTEVPASASRAEGKKYSVTVSALKAGTVYEYKAYCDGFEEQGSRTFTTESLFTIPNAGLEEWSNLTSNNKVLIPGAGGSVSFWDTGNHGSSTMNKLVTNQSDALKHGGNYSAELKSQFVGIGSIGKFAAGNLFVGSYDKTDGTDGELTFGRPYNGSHPKALTLYANYRPGKGVGKKGADSNYIAEGATDEGQIYVALTSAPVSIKTKSKQLFDANADYVVAYGQVTWTGDFGADGSLDKVTIPLEYTSRAKTTKPTHLVIVCSASKYGDFFSGGEGSLLYVDDFELEY